MPDKASKFAALSIGLSQATASLALLNQHVVFTEMNSSLRHCRHQYPGGWSLKGGHPSDLRTRGIGFEEHESSYPPTSFGETEEGQTVLLG